jgi:hypothetical protein
LAKPGFECDLVAQATHVGEQIGSQGGVPQDTVGCVDGFAVGLAVALTADPDGAHNNEYIVVKISMLCAGVVERDGGFEIEPTTSMLVVEGGSATQGDQTATCGPTQVVVGLDAHMVEAAGLFNSVAIECAALSPSGLARETSTTIAVPNTGTELQDGHATCTGGAVVSGFKGWSGNHVDQLQLQCSAPACR